MNDQTNRAILTTDTTSRRTILRRVGIGGLAAALAAVPTARLAAQEATPSAEPEFFQAFREEWATAAATGDAAPVMPFYAPDAVFEDVAFGVTLRGPAEIESFLAGFFASYVDASVEWRNVIAAGDRAAAEVLFSGSAVGEDPEASPGTGPAVTVRSVHVYEFGDERIVRQTLYFDAYGLLIQLGVLPPPGTPEADS